MSPANAGTHENEQEIRVEPERQAEASLIWLHGLGADGYDFLPLVQELPPLLRHRTRFIFPHAPQRPVALNAGYIMRAWYDIHGLTRSAPEDEAGILASAARITERVEAEMASGISARRIVLAGFSQGGALAVHTALRLPYAVGGLLALSAYLTRPHRLAAEITSAGLRLPIALHHGRYDEVLPLALGRELREALSRVGCKLSWQEWNMGHEVCAEEIAAIAGWLQQRLVE